MNNLSPKGYGLQPQQGGDTGQRVDKMMELLVRETKETVQQFRVLGRRSREVSDTLGSTRRAVGGGPGKFVRGGIAAMRGGIAAATTAHVGLGAVAAGVGLAGAASPNGLQPLTQALHLLAAKIGGVLLPALVNLSAGIMTLADALPKAEEAKKGVDTGVKLAGAVPGPVGLVTNPLASAWETITDPEGSMRRTRGEAEPPQPQEKSAFQKNRDMILKGMMASIGSHGQGGIADAAKKAQEAALGGGVEFKILQAQLDALNPLRETAANTRNLQVTK